MPTISGEGINVTVEQIPAQLDVAYKAINFVSKGVAKVAEDGEQTTLDVDCVGHIVLNADESTYNAFYCTYKAANGDALVVKGEGATAQDGSVLGGTINVMQGSGKWANAKGGGEFQYTHLNPAIDRTAYTFSLDYEIA